MGCLIALLCIIIFGLLPLGIIAEYEAGMANFWIVIGPFRYQVYPRMQTKRKRSPRNDRSFESHAKVKKNTVQLSGYLPYVRLVLNFLIDFRTKLRVNELRFKAMLAGGDPCDLSINYGRAWAALANLMPLIDRCFMIKKRDLEIMCDYTADATIINGYVNLTITVAQLLALGAYHGVKILNKYFEISKKAKDGAMS